MCSCPRPVPTGARQLKKCVAHIPKRKFRGFTCPDSWRQLSGWALSGIGALARGFHYPVPGSGRRVYLFWTIDPLKASSV